MTNIFNLNPSKKSDFGLEYVSEGLVTIPGVPLPGCFRPEETDVVFLKAGEYCEVYIGSGVAFEGDEPSWQKVMTGAEQPGQTRQVLAVRGDFYSGLSAFNQMLQKASTERDIGQRRATTQPAPGSQQTATALEQRPAQRARGEIYRGPLRNMVADAAQSSRRFFGRQEELRSMITSLLRESKPGVVLVGPPGVGKTTVVEMLAKRIADREVPAQLEDAALLELPLGSLIERCQHIGDMEREARRLLEVQRNRPIFFADEVHQITRPELRPLTDLLKPALAEGKIRMIGATTPTEWRQMTDAAFRRRLAEIGIREPSMKETYHMVKERLASLSEHHGLDFTDEDVRIAILLADRFLPERYFPDKAIDLVDQAAAMQMADLVKEEER